MTLNEKKCCSGTSNIDFIGHTLSRNGEDHRKGKVEAVADARKPRTVAEVKSFLGLVGYCSKFIPDFSTKTDPMRQLTLDKKLTDSRFLWKKNKLLHSKT